MILTVVYPDVDLNDTGTRRQPFGDGANPGNWMAMATLEHDDQTDLTGDTPCPGLSLRRHADAPTCPRL
jgi:hypothetical protein